MNRRLIVDASATDSRVMSSLLMRAGHDPVSASVLKFYPWSGNVREI